MCSNNFRNIIRAEVVGVEPTTPLARRTSLANLLEKPLSITSKICDNWGHFPTVTISSV
jgi:hypothetical protein